MRQAYQREREEEEEEMMVTVTKLLRLDIMAHPLTGM